MLFTSRTVRSICLLAFLATPTFAQSGIVAAGSNAFGQCDVPAAPVGVEYTFVDSSTNHSIALRSDGELVAWGLNDFGQCDVPALPPGMTYVRASAGYDATVALRSDGTLLGWGYNGNGNLDIPAPPPGMVYVDAWTGFFYTIALRSDGQLVPIGFFIFVPLPALPPGEHWLDCSLGQTHMLGLRSDGQVFATGFDYFGELSVPPLPSGLTYTRISAGHYSSSALRSDGQLLAWGLNDQGQCNVPAPPPGVSYVDFSLSTDHGLALRSDGGLVGWGSNTSSVFPLPPAPPGHEYREVDAGAGHNLARYAFVDAPTYVYCTAKVNSLGCTPSIGSAGALSLSGPDNFVVSASSLHNQRSGLLFWGRAPNAQPHLNGLLCVASPLHRTPIQATEGSTTGDDCTGALHFAFTHAYLDTQGILIGEDLYAQFWSRDAAAVPYVSNLTDALHVRVAPYDGAASLKHRPRICRVAAGAWLRTTIRSAAARGRACRAWCAGTWC